MMRRAALTSEQLVEEYKRTHPKSQELHERAVQLFSAEGATHTARIFSPFRPYIIRAKGSRKWDVDGNEYIDYTMGHGGLILGHSHPAIVQAIQEQAAKGVHFGSAHELEIEWAELIKELMPAVERVEFCACGNEANMLAIRLARVFTGRTRILRFEENFHGWGDEVVAPGSAGAFAPEVTVIPMHDLGKLEKELAKEQYAAVLTEAGGAHMGGQIPWDPNFIHKLSGLSRKYGTVWIVDEVVTGFRDAPGGWQSIIGVTPDLTTLGKCVGGGLASGAVAGRSDILEAFNPKSPAEKRIRHTGTWNANPLLCAAGVAACKLYLNGEPQRITAENGAYLRQQGNKALQERNISGRLYGRTMIHLYMGPLEFETDDPLVPPTKSIKNIMNPEMVAVKGQLCLHMLHRGIDTIGARYFAMSMAHSKEDIDHTIDVFGSSLDDMIAENLIT